jgi:hypothetical protein
MSSWRACGSKIFSETGSDSRRVGLEMQKDGTPTGSLSRPWQSSRRRRTGVGLGRAVIREYDKGPYVGVGAYVQKAFATFVPPDADASALAGAIVQVVNTPFGKRPFRVHIDPTEDGASVGFTVLDRVRAEMLHRVGLSDLLKLIVRV